MLSCTSERAGQLRLGNLHPAHIVNGLDAPPQLPRELGTIATELFDRRLDALILELLPADKQILNARLGCHGGVCLRHH